MRMKREEAALLLIVAFGVAMRCLGLGIPDLATDEAQYVLGDSIGHPPLGIAILHATQFLGQSLIAARAVSAIFGILTILLIYGLAKMIFPKRGALLAAALASVFPSAILFSRLAYLDTMLGFFWGATTLCFLAARKQRHPFALLCLFLASLAATFIKTQGFLLPLFLLVGHFLSSRGRVLKDDIFWLLVLSLLPIAFFIPAHPGILATLALYGGNMFGIGGFASRVSLLLFTWKNILGIAMIVLLCGILALRSVPWPIWILLIIGSFLSLFLGPTHEYYTVFLVFWTIPAAAIFIHFKLWLRSLLLATLVANAFLLLPPSPSFATSSAELMYQKEGWWNAHAATVNTVLVNAHADSVIVLGAAGQELRWYVRPEVFVGKEMDVGERPRIYLVTDPKEAKRIQPAKILYGDENLQIDEH